MTYLLERSPFVCFSRNSLGEELLDSTSLPSLSVDEPLLLTRTAYSEEHISETNDLAIKALKEQKKIFDDFISRGWFFKAFSALKQINIQWIRKEFKQQLERELKLEIQSQIRKTQYSKVLSLLLLINSSEKREKTLQRIRTVQKIRKLQAEEQRLIKSIQGCLRQGWIDMALFFCRYNSTRSHFYFYSMVINHLISIGYLQQAQQILQTLNPSSVTQSIFMRKIFQRKVQMIQNNPSLLEDCLNCLEVINSRVQVFKIYSQMQNYTRNDSIDDLMVMFYRKRRDFFRSWHELRTQMYFERGDYDRWLTFFNIDSAIQTLNLHRFCQKLLKKWNADTIPQLRFIMRHFPRLAYLNSEKQYRNRLFRLICENYLLDLNFKAVLKFAQKNLEEKDLFKILKRTVYAISGEWNADNRDILRNTLRIDSPVSFLLAQGNRFPRQYIEDVFFEKCNEGSSW
ncbi:MAG: hypothetical protein JW769_01615 [Parachlamydiales bacterium]|nr:hypothetical protein [Parachlamydiales bacterium]